MTKNVVICDLDGTLADVNHRLHYIKNPDGTLKPYAERDWDSFNDACRYDVPNNDVIEILHEVANLGACTHLGEYTGREVYILSGRNEVTRRRTVKWLKKYVYSYLDYDTHLIMRKADDRRPDTEVKLEMVRELGLTPDDVLCVLDDRQCVVDMWRENGFRCLQVEAWEEVKKPSQKLVDAVIEEMKWDIANNDWTAIDSLLYNVDPALLKGFLPEETNDEKK